jgi:hypothetical protein
MRLKVFAVAALIAAGAALGPQFISTANALPAGPSLQSVAPDRSLRVEVGMSRCQAWRFTCADRWGWGTWRFRRCMRLHAC